MSPNLLVRAAKDKAGVLSPPVCRFRPHAAALDFQFDPRCLRRPKKAELIAEEICRSIVRRQLSPGDRLPNEREMIEQLRSSRGTVREALKPTFPEWPVA